MPEFDKIPKEIGRLFESVAEQIDEVRKCRGLVNDIIQKQTCHSEYLELGASIGVTVDEKQKAYGDSFGRSGDVMRILYPDGISPEQYDDALAITRIIDKLFRIATDKDAFGESPYRDIAGYGILGAARERSDGSSTTEDQG